MQVHEGLGQRLLPRAYRDAGHVHRHRLALGRVGDDDVGVARLRVGAREGAEFDGRGADLLVEHAEQLVLPALEGADRLELGDALEGRVDVVLVATPDLGGHQQRRRALRAGIGRPDDLAAQVLPPEVAPGGHGCRHQPAVVHDGDRVQRHAVAAELRHRIEVARVRHRVGRRLGDAVAHRLPALEDVEVDEIEAGPAALGIGAGPALRRAAEQQVDLDAVPLLQRADDVLAQDALLLAPPDSHRQLVAAADLGAGLAGEQGRRGEAGGEQVAAIHGGAPSVIQAMASASPCSRTGAPGGRAGSAVGRSTRMRRGPTAIS